MHDFLTTQNSIGHGGGSSIFSGISLIQTGIISRCARTHPLTTMPIMNAMDREGLRLALEQARKSYKEGGIPIGSALLLSLDPSNKFDGVDRVKVLGSGHNERIQKSSPTLHAEISALENAGRLKADIYQRSTIVSPFVSFQPTIVTYFT